MQKSSTSTKNRVSVALTDTKKPLFVFSHHQFNDRNKLISKQSIIRKSALTGLNFQAHIHKRI